jgi:hypothetical protein
MLLTGRQAFRAETDARQIVAIMTAPLPPIIRDGVSHAAKAVISTSMARNPNDRYASCGDLADALVEAMQEVPARASGLSHSPENGERETYSGSLSKEATRRKESQPTWLRPPTATSGARTPNPAEGDRSDVDGYTAPEATRLRTETVDMSASQPSSRPDASSARPSAVGLPRVDSVNRSLAQALAALEFETTTLPRGYTEKVAETLTRGPIDIGETACSRIVPFLEDRACADEDSEPGALVRVPRGFVATGVLFAFADRVVLAAGPTNDLTFDVCDRDNVFKANWITVRHGWRSRPGYALTLSAEDELWHRLLFLDVDADLEIADEWWAVLDEIFIAE